MKSSRIAFAILTLSTLCRFTAAATAAEVPAVNSGIINYSTNQITLTGSGFEPAKKAPTLLFNGITLTLVSTSDTQIIATLPAGVAPGTFNLVVTNNPGNSVDFDMAYGAIGPQGPSGPAGPAGAQGLAGPAGATGVQGVRGLTGAPGAPGPAGANGIGFSFLNAFDPYATYALNNVVTFNGSSYVALVANGPNPSGPTPDKNPSWSVMAAAGQAGPAGSQGPLGDPGPQGLMGNPGSVGPAGPAGPQGPTGGVLSFAASNSLNPIQLQSSPTTVASVVLQNIGTYVLGGQVSIYNEDSSRLATAGCFVWVNAQLIPGVPDASQTLQPLAFGALPLSGYYVNSSAPTTLNVECNNSGPSTSAQAATIIFTAVQVQ